MECTLCNKQYLGNAETAFNIRLNNHRKDTKDLNAILTCTHFEQQGHNFNCHTKFIIIDKLVNTSSSTRKLNTTRKLLDPETENFSSVRTEPRTQQKDNEGPRAAFARSFLPRQQQPSHLRTQMIT